MKIFNSNNAFKFIVLLIIFGIVQGLITGEVLSPFYVMTLILVCIYIIIALSQNLITGFTGQLAIGHAGFMAIGAYMSALITVKFHGPLLLGLLFGALISAVAGLLIGLPTLRLRGDYLAIAT
jgi:branched-chain amino acid transport system permease protein